jgi:hypothetical protein
MSAENLIIETDGDLLLIFTRRIPKKDATAGDGVLRKRKTYPTLVATLSNGY